MAEPALVLRGHSKAEAYDILARQVDSVLDGIDDDIAAMATISALIANAFGHLWVGFYRIVQDGQLLRVGPYQGTIGCLEIRVGAGVCGSAAAERTSIVVRDVNDFPGHIACDARSRSEIVVPCFDTTGKLIAVLDIDSSEPGTFDDTDRRGLERIVSWFRRSGGGG